MEKAWNFIITETLQRTVRVRAENYEDAYNKIESLYLEEKIILSADDFTDKEIKGLSYYNPDNEKVENDETYPVDDDFSDKETD